MPTLFTDTDKKFWYHQPNLTRWRHMFRSPRNSLKINQEIGQYHYDLARINARTEAVSTSTENMIDYVYNGWDGDGDFDYNDGSPHTNIEFIGIEEMTMRLDNLRNRLKNLEN